MLVSSTCPLLGQCSGGSKLRAFPPSNGVVFSRVFKRAMAPSDVSSVVQFSTSFNIVLLATSMMLRTIPTCAPLTCPRYTAAIETIPVETAADERSRTMFSHLWRHKRRNSGRWEVWRLRIFSCIATSDQPKDRIVSRPSTCQI